MAASTESTLEVTDLTHSYGSLKALTDINLQIPRGEIFGLIGPNGAGKTTLIRALVGSLTPSLGNVSVLGLDPKTDRWRLRQQIGYMPQRPALYDDLTVAANVSFFLSGHRRHPDPDLVAGALDFVDLADRAHDRVHTLSGGMQQRLSLACALAHKPDVLFLDEPTSGVDPELRASFWEGFRRLTQRGATIVVSTHQMDEALACQRIAVLSHGLKVADEDPRVLASGARALVRVWKGDSMTEHTMEDYRVELPRLLESISVDRIEIVHETLQDVVLRLIRSAT